MTPFTSFMSEALRLAENAAKLGEVPVGAVVVRGADVLGRGQNAMRASENPLEHAEIRAIRDALKRSGQSRLSGCDLYVTLEPCAMCAGAIANARIARLFIGALDPKSGGTIHGARVFDHPQTHHKPEIYDGFEADRAESLLKAFFSDIR